MINPVKQTLKDFVSSSITINEIFLATLVLAIQFFVALPSFDISNIENFGNLLTLFGVTCLAVGFPLYYSYKIIFKSHPLSKNLSGWFNLWYTLWLIMFLIPVLVAYLGSKLSPSNLSTNDYLILIYITLLFLRLICLFLFSARFKIQELSVKHIPVNKFFLIGTTIYILYVFYREYNLLSGYDYLELMLPVAAALTSGSVFLDLYYGIFCRR